METDIFVCTRSRDSPKPCCADYGAENVFSTLRNITLQNGMHDTVRVRAAQCLGECPKGVMAVVYPKGKWFVCTDTLPEELKKMCEM